MKKLSLLLLLVGLTSLQVRAASVTYSVSGFTYSFPSAGAPVDITGFLTFDDQSVFSDGMTALRT